MAAGVLTLNGWGGCFAESRSLHSLPRSEDELDERQFLTANDYRSGYLPIEEIGYEIAIYGDEDEEKNEGFVKRLIAVELNPEQIRAAAKVVLENPELLIELYREGIHSDELARCEQRIARMKIFQLVLDMVSAMLTIKPKKHIVRSLVTRRDMETDRTLLACIARYARYEVKNAKKCRHFTAATILVALGYPDPYHQCLD